MKVFVSSTYEDLKPYRAAVGRAIQQLGHQPIMMENFVSSSNPPKRECLDKVRESDILIGIYAYRYGSVPRGDDSSITEQEYQYALSKGKEVYCFLVAPEAKWPESQKDKDDRLENFLDGIKRDHTVNFFETPEDLVLRISPVIAKVQEEHMGPWQRVAKERDNREKLELINNLIGRNNRGELSDIALKSSAKLLSSDFTDFSPSTTFEFIGATGKLLQGNIWIGDYVRDANRFARESTPRKPLKEKAGQSIKRFFIPILISFLIGLLVGALSYIFNWFDARSKFMTFQSANRVDVISWLIKDKVEGKFKIDSFDSEETKYALFALGLAMDLETKGNHTNEYLNRLLRDIDHRISIFTTPPPELLQENLKILEEINLIVPPQARAIKARIALAILKCLEKDPSVSYDRLQNTYNDILRSYSEFINAKLYTQKIDSLKKVKEEFEFQKTKQASQTLTIYESIKSWGSFAATKTVGSQERTYADSEIERLTKISETNATIVNETDFVTCQGVERDKRQPFGISDRFSPGSIWAWARIKAPRAENVTLRWYTKQGEYDSRTVQISSPSQTYHTWFAKHYGIEYEGLNEVRLYNEQNILIGRRVFRIGS